MMTSTNNNFPKIAKSTSLELISKAPKKSALTDNSRDKMLGMKAANLKFNYPEDYRNFADEDKVLIDDAIERAGFIIREENEKSFKMIRPPEPDNNRAIYTNQIMPRVLY